jgi:hypothetical protein
MIKMAPRCSEESWYPEHDRPRLIGFRTHHGGAMASDAAGWITGTVMDIAGGSVLV